MPAAGQAPAASAHPTIWPGHPPPPGEYALILWDGASGQHRLNVKGLSWGFGLGEGQPSVVAVGGAVGGKMGADGERDLNDPLPVTLSVTATGGAAEVASVITRLNGADVPAEALLHASTNAPPIPPDQIGGLMAGKTEGPWQIVCAGDVRVVRYGHCPPTHLPAYSTQTREEAERLIAQTCAIGYDGTSRIAPELAFGLTLPALQAFGARVDAIARGAFDEVDMPAPADLIAMARHKLIERGLDVPPPVDLDPPSPAPQSLEEQIATQQGGFRVLRPDDFVMWAAERGLVNPAALERAHFPGAERVLAYSQGWFALWYRDHVRLGKLAPVAPAPPATPTPPASSWTPVAERMPPDRVWVLVKGDAGMSDGRAFVRLARRDRAWRGDSWMDETNTRLSDAGLDPTHWRLPDDVIG